MPKNYLIYCTANEKKYFADVIHLERMCRISSGVEQVSVVIVVSKVKKWGALDEAFKSYVEKILKRTPQLQLLSVISKSNVGRDFSSVQEGLKYLSHLAEAEDYMMVRNRSAFGPFNSGWYREFSDQFHRKKNIGLVGNTINLSSSVKSQKDWIHTHVQTYLYFTIWQNLKPIVDNFPGTNEVTKVGVINAGEIGLSQYYLKTGFLLTSLSWPNHFFDLLNISDPELPQKDIKGKDLGLPFKHRSASFCYVNFFIVSKWIRYVFQNRAYAS